MIHQITNCRNCPLYHYDFEGYAECNHPDNIEGLIDCKFFPDNEVKEGCPLKAVDLILTVKK